MSRLGGLSAPLIALGSVLVAAATAVALVLALPVDPPQALATATSDRVVRVSHRTDADERQVQLSLETGSPRSVVTARTGTVTSFQCTTGGTVASGDVIATVDGAPVIAIATAMPPWRDLERGDRGDDVRALQEELARLGSPVRVDGIVGPGTIRAARTFLTARGVDRDDLKDGVVPVESFAWIPATTSTVRSCGATVGAPVPDGGILAELPAELRSARLDPLPTGVTAGARTIAIGVTTAAIREDGVVDDPHSLAEIAALPEYQATVASADGVPTLSATWALKDPPEVAVVPPDALWAVTETSACVQPDRGKPRRVEVVGSELGQAFVRDPDGSTLDRVRTDPDRRSSCR